MARETFISYKYDESQHLRDEIINKLGDAVKFYRGEAAESPDISDTTVDNIKKNLKDMMFGTSVTIVIISPNMTKSKWIDWEIEYSLKEISRGDTTSRVNGIIGVIMEVDGGYDWLVSSNNNPDGCKSRSIDKDKLYEIINKNRCNLNSENKFSCEKCRSYDQLTGSYISLVEENIFLKNPEKYIENAYDKSKVIYDYDIVKMR
ncbi:TIR domain-containing protein [Xenorhabdus sp. XENO-1]|uniref:TIR domain-containing protein n=1 Tax=Xenorhabdus bovienii TaxID=40576 RepID=UPI0020CA72BF|nr:TIR domain-containing protein [Xenorhabdus bovienii]MCP9267863.1 TIR domain-containing protein [Xenorhabdus bovienii subsp. africana]